ncbi:uncharacterized protein LOC127839376 isoform X3 [Dreissena polymorpha]|uniref:Uncharacterized protein n=1 Tax=Dreissena polymorpha TaxID=45954 RepID=A0A9D4FQE9_DREPO|nr:uncharacterized protein LOC127839376 isoform X3 [Dreissena polymorpha]KAH3801809.1 hypothetical protein DPMN_155471 [Dreissena polymorpha]
MFLKIVLLVVFLYNGLVSGSTTWPYYYTTAAYPTTAAAGCGACPTCPPGYSTYQTNNHGQCRCLCEYTGYYYQASTPQHVGRGVLMQILRNLQTNAAALEQMASGVSDEANIAESVANSSK